MDTRQKIMLTVGVILSLFIFFSIFQVSLRKPNTGIGEISGKRGEHSVDLPEEFTIEQFSAPLNYTMNSGSKSTLDAALSESYDVQIPEKNPLQVGTTVTYQGTPLPLKNNSVENINVTNGPSVDGTPNKPPSMSLFRYNECKPECCPGPYSCDRGCVCTTVNQKDFIATRGKNDM
tara:strand:- start:4310 stop:4837 length:528 start_codon:yes stop_codon:yes gene_type:complete